MAEITRSVTGSLTVDMPWGFREVESTAVTDRRPRRGMVVLLIVLGLTTYASAAPTWGGSFVVNSTLDAADTNPGDGLCQTATPGECTLRAAVEEANVFAGADEIGFHATLTGATISLTAVGDGTYGPSALGVESAMVIDGSGAPGVAIAPDPASSMRLLYVSPTGDLRLENVTLRDGIALRRNGGGSDSGGMGGGAASLGGAVFNQGVLELRSSTLSANQAIGGDGGAWISFDRPHGGGGGGLTLGGENGGAGFFSSGGRGGDPNGGAGGGPCDPSGCPNPGESGDAGGVGGGGGGGGHNAGHGGNGGFGGGGGGGASRIGCSLGPPYDDDVGGAGGDGGFGGGGGGGGGDNCIRFPTSQAGTAGFGGGDGGFGNESGGGGGGGGAGLGGAIFNDGGTVIAKISTFSGNTAGGGTGTPPIRTVPGGIGGSAFGGAIFSRDGTVILAASTFSSNVVTPGPGGSADGEDIYGIGAFELVEPDVTVTSTNDSGAGSLRQAIANAQIFGVDVVDIAVAGPLLLSTVGDVTQGSSAFAITAPLNIHGNGAEIRRDPQAPDFRHFYVAPGGDLTLHDLTLSGGVVDFGGAIFVNAGSLSLEGSTIYGNTATGVGGGIWSNSSVTLAKSTISGNIAAFAGGIENSFGTLIVNDSTISGNTCTNNGGGIDNTNGTLAVTNSTLSGNQAGWGGAILNFGGAATIESATIIGNTDTTGGGGIYNSGGTLLLENTIIADSTPGDLAGSAAEAASHHNLVGDPESAGGLVDGVNSNIVGDGAAGLLPVVSILDPVLANNGGPTLTHNLVPTSPAIDGGTTDLTLDQRGMPRPYGASDDIGAVEYSPMSRIVVEVQTIPAGDPTLFTFVGDASGAIGDGQSLSQDVVPGTYNVTEFISGSGPNRIVFVTSSSYTGDLVTEANNLGLGLFDAATPGDGLRAGDAICNFHAQNAVPQLDGLFAVWLSDSTTNAFDRFTPPGGPWVLNDLTETHVADDLVDLTTCDPGMLGVCELDPFTSCTDDFECPFGSCVGACADDPFLTCDSDSFCESFFGAGAVCNLPGVELCLDAPIHGSEDFDSTVGLGFVMTATTKNGTRNTAHCSDWTSSTGSVSTGSTNSIDGSWTSCCGSSCGNNRPLYCFEQTEATATPWRNLLSIECDDTDSTGDLGTKTATFQVEIGETVTCVFTNALDTDADGANDGLDNCTLIPNADQRDTNNDGFGNVCDPDIGGAIGPGVDDCLVNFSDLGFLKQAFFTTPASPNWNPDADLTGGPGGAPDDVVNFADLGRLKAFFFQAPGPGANACFRR